MKKIIAFCIVGAIIGVAAVVVPRYLNDYKKSVSCKKILYIPIGSTYEQLLDTVATAVCDMKSFKKVAQKASLSEKFNAGRYIFTPDNTNKELVRTLAMGWESPMMLTLSGNIRGLEKLSGIL
jgi:cell division protein YceG involved in septum cleavage